MREGRERDGECEQGQAEALHRATSIGSPHDWPAWLMRR
jgi:hypothetical protein